MTRKAGKVDVQRTRRDNYVTHFEARKYIKSLPPEMQMCYLEASRDSIPPALNPYGADSYNDQEWTLIIRMALTRGLQAFYINEWYVTEEGWQKFQCQWQNLPEEFEMQPVDMAWSHNRP